MGAKRKKRPGRIQPSSIDRLPEDVRLQVNTGLRDRGVTQKEILKDVNPILSDRGVKTISKSALGRYAVKVAEQGAMMNEARARSEERRVGKECRL